MTSNDTTAAAAAVHSSGTDSLRVGVIGLGFAGQAALKGFLRIPGVEVIGLAGLETDRLAELGKEHQIPHLYERWEDLLARDDLDAVSVATPNYLHEPITVAALEGGRHVLCEKPLAHSGVEAEKMVQAAIDNNRVLEVCFNHRQRGDVQTLKRHIDTGALGRIYYAKAHWVRRSGIPGMGSWFTSKALSGGGPLIDLGVHMLDMSLHLLGDPTVLAASGATFAEFGPHGKGGSAYASKQAAGSVYDVEDLATAYLRLEGGGVLQLETSWAMYREPGDLFGVELYGTDGGARIAVSNYANEDTLRIFTDVGGVPAEITPKVGRGEGHAAIVRNFVDVIREGNWADHVGREGLVRSKVIDAIYQSALEGREVLVSD